MVKKKTIKSEDMEWKSPVQQNMVLEEDTDRVKALLVSKNLPVSTLIAMLKHLPSDAKIHNLFHDQIRNKRILVVQSQEFFPVTEGEPIPDILFSIDEKGRVVGEVRSRGFLDELETL